MHTEQHRLYAHTARTYPTYAAYASSSSSESEDEDVDTATAKKSAPNDSSNNESSDSDSSDSDSSDGEDEAKSKAAPSNSGLPSALGLLNTVKKPDYLVKQKNGAVEVQEFSLAAVKKQEAEQARLQAAAEAKVEAERAAAKAERAAVRAAAEKKKVNNLQDEAYKRQTGAKSKREMTAKVMLE